MFNINNVGDLKTLFMYAVCEYLDGRKLDMEILDLYEKYDEYLDYYDTAEWYRITEDVPEVDRTLARQAYDSIQETNSLFNELFDQTRENLKNILLIVFKSDTDLQEKLFGKRYILSPEKCDKLLDLIDEDLCSEEYEYVMETAFEKFAALLKKQLDKL